MPDQNLKVLGVRLIFKLPVVLPPPSNRKGEKYVFTGFFVFLG